MLNDWDREKLRQALGPDTGDKVADLINAAATAGGGNVAELTTRLEAIEADNASLKAANEALAAEVAELKSTPVAPAESPAPAPTSGTIDTSDDE